MSRALVRKRFWLESSAFAVFAGLAILTLVWPDWLEGIFGYDPDAHNGAFEIGLTVLAGAVALVSALLARAEWRRAASEIG